MAKEKNQPKTEKFDDKKLAAPMTEQAITTTEKTEMNTAEKKQPAEKEKQKPKKETPKVKKYEATAFGRGLPVSMKESMYICEFIKGKKIDEAIQLLQEVQLLKRAVPYRGEVPHRKGKGIMSGRYPVKTAGYFINLLKGLKGNAVVNGLDLETTRIYFGSPHFAHRPPRSGGRKGKRAHIILKAKEVGSSQRGASQQREKAHSKNESDLIQMEKKK